MKLSVITVVRNVAERPGLEALKKCLASVDRLPIEHEHIVQDGASTDGTVAFMEDYIKTFEAGNVKLQSVHDAGIYDALNRGIARSTGEWIYVLGADDRILAPDKLMAALEQGENENADMVASPVWSSEDCTRTLPFCPLRALCSMSFPHQGLLMRKHLIDELGGFDIRYRIGSDYDLILRALLSGARTSIFETAYTYYSLEGFSTANEADCRDEHLQILQGNLKVTESEAVRMSSFALAPWRLAVRYLMSRSPVLRRSARYLLLRCMANSIGLINKKGALFWR